MKVGILGLGRIGKIHLSTLQQRIDGAEVLTVVTPGRAGQKLAFRSGVKCVSSNPNDIFENPEIDAVVICSPSDSHAEYVIKAAKSGKAIFCEKPLDLSLEKIKEILSAVEEHKVPLMVAFNQRFDGDFSRIKQVVKNGDIGDLRTIKITSRDPAPPSIEYIQKSGGLFLDMTIHDFDMARYIADSEVVEVFAKGSNLVDPAIGMAGDIDTGLVILTFENKVTAIIENSRQAAYGYDQRLEAFGSEGMAQADNRLKDTHQLFNQSGIHKARPLDSFMDRYLDSYKHEMEAFIKALKKKETPPVTGEDGLKATIIALAANKSMRDNRPIKISEVL